jgi:hypothetical protein
MARMARAEVFAPDEVAVVHVMNRVVRCCYLLGNDPVSGKNYDHHKVMIENQLQRLAGAFGIDLLGLAAKRLLRGCRRLSYSPESPQIGFCRRLR